MKLVDFDRPVRASWLREQDCRLDAPPFLSGALQTRKLLERLPVPKEPLASLTTGYNGGIYNGPMFRRNYVIHPDYGVPFLTSGSILLADLSTIPLLSKKDAYSSRLAYLQVKEGMTLISCSGSIGRMAYARSNMDGMWSSQDVIKVVPDPNRIPPGYLYAFLSSKFGVPLVVGNTYGAIIQHIEPHHIADLPVPRLGEKVEHQVHSMVQEASRLISDYHQLVQNATNTLFEHRGIANPSSSEWKATASADLGFSVSISEMETLRAWNHSRRVHQLHKEIKSGQWTPLGELIDLEWLRWRKMFQRIDAEPEFGIEVITQKQLFNIYPEGRWISRNYLLNHSPRYVIPDETILIAKQGTLGEDELFCRCEFITGSRMLERAYSDHCMRIVVRDNSIHPGYLYAFLRSNTGFRLLRGLSEGSKQQDLHWRTVPHLPIPRCSADEENKIGQMIRTAYKKRNTSVDLTFTARRIIEQAIKSNT